MRSHDPGCKAVFTKDEGDCDCTAGENEMSPRMPQMVAQQSARLEAQRIDAEITAALTAATKVAPLEKRPFAFRVKHDDGWVLFVDEKAAQEFANEIGVDYQGLYVRTSAAEVGESVPSAWLPPEQFKLAAEVGESRPYRITDRMLAEALDREKTVEARTIERCAKATLAAALEAKDATIKHCIKVVRDMAMKGYANIEDAEEIVAAIEAFMEKPSIASGECNNCEQDEGA